MIRKSGLSQIGERTIDPPISWLMKLALERPKLISLAAGFTDNASLPVEESAQILTDLFGSPERARAALQYGSTAGDEDLRRLTLARVAGQDGLAAKAYDPNNLLITHGSQQFLYLVTECLCDTDDIVLVEDPTYFVYLSILQSHGIAACGVQLLKDGIDLENLEAVLERLKKEGALPRVKLLYLVSYFQNPSGITTSLEKKCAALKILRRYEKDAGHPIFLLEDAAYRELRFTGEDISSSLSVDSGHSRAIYSGTYSKPFATGVRVGFGFLPEMLLKPVLRLKGNHDFGTSHLLQQVLNAALLSGKYESHLPVLRERYQHKASVMADALRKYFPKSVQWDLPSGGLYFWARSPKNIATGPKSRLFNSALQNDVLYVPGELCYAADETRPVPRNEMRLSFGSASENNIVAGIERLGTVLRDVV